MILKAFSILDTKVGQFGLPFFSHHSALAVRIVIEAASDENTSIAKYPNDYVLYSIGSYDDTNGVLRADPPENLGVVGALVHAAISENVRRASYSPASVPAGSGVDNGVDQ